MTRILAIEGMEDLFELNELCRKASESVFLTKNGYGAMVAMSIQTYDRLTEQSKKDLI